MLYSVRRTCPRTAERLLAWLCAKFATAYAQMRKFHRDLVAFIVHTRVKICTLFILLYSASTPAFAKKAQEGNGETNPFVIHTAC